jgi:GTP diphosphokinase / guanosine-3',5'-bis(diphosphate) 3'-diphosphatase
LSAGLEEAGRQSQVPIMNEFIRALVFAATKHRDQRRKDVTAAPYINHPIAVANVLANEAGITDPVVLSAALLHDTIEDTKTTAAELEEQFGQKVTSIVLEITDDKSLQKPIRKQLQIDNAARLSTEAKLVNLADKICNLRDTAVSPKVGWSVERTQAYFDWAAQVIAGVRGINPTLEALFDEVYTRGRPKELSRQGQETPA